jgi:tetratricopeptide (TPR) repeat protein
VVDIEKACARAAELNEAHQIFEAIECWSDVLELAPDCSIARYGLVRLCLEISDFQRAGRLCEESELWTPDALTLAAHSHYCQAVYEVPSALEMGRRAWACDSNSPQAAYAYHGSLLLSADELGARDFLAELEGRFDDHSELAVERASRAELSPTDQYEHIVKVVRKFPHCRTARFVVVTILNGFHDDAATDEALSWSIAHSPFSGDVHALGSLIALQRDQLTYAAESSQKAIELNGFSALGHFVQFHLALCNGARDEAHEIARGVESWGAGSIVELTLVSQMWTQLGELDDLKARLILKYEAGAPSPEVGLALARIAAKLGDGDEALLWIEKARANWDGHFDATIELARALVERGEMSACGALLVGLSACESVDELRLRIAAANGVDMPGLVSAYEQYLRQYPTFDFVWGILLRYYLESDHDSGVDWLLSHPRPVPPYVRHAVEAYRAVVRFDIEVAQTHLQSFIDTRTTDARWSWCWELVLESLEEPSLNHWLPALAKAAEADGL